MESARKMHSSLLRWLDSYQGEVKGAAVRKLTKHDAIRCIPFILLHFSCFAVLWVGVSKIAVFLAVLAYFVRMFAITGFYHRYFSHRTFRTNRFWQFVFAAIGSTAVQRGPLWWAAHHRTHHRHSDTDKDLHSPERYGFFWSHMFWFMSEQNFVTKTKLVKDWMKYPELVLLDRFDTVLPILFAASVLSLGMLLEMLAPGLGTNGPQLLVWVFCVSTVVLYHGTFTINSLAHVWGSRRYDVHDNSRNNWFLALVTLGEGWHNNHHHYPVAARQGFYWWEIDVTYYLLVVMEKFGIVSDLEPVPARVYDEGSRRRHAT